MKKFFIAIIALVVVIGGLLLPRNIREYVSNTAQHAYETLKGQFTFPSLGETQQIGESLFVTDLIETPNAFLKERVGIDLVGFLSAIFQLILDGLNKLLNLLLTTSKK